MNKSWILIIGTAIVVLIFFLGIQKKFAGDLIGPNFLNIKGIQVSPTPTPSPTPKTFQFNNATDLNQELESVNPEVKDSDFENLQQIKNSI